MAHGVLAAGKRIVAQQTTRQGRKALGDEVEHAQSEVGVVQVVSGHERLLEAARAPARRAAAAPRAFPAPAAGRRTPPPGRRSAADGPGTAAPPAGARRFFDDRREELAGGRRRGPPARLPVRLQIGYDAARQAGFEGFLAFRFHRREGLAGLLETQVQGAPERPLARSRTAAFRPAPDRHPPARRLRRARPQTDQRCDNRQKGPTTLPHHFPHVSVVSAPGPDGIV